MRFEELLMDISSHGNKWIKGTIHTELYNNRHPDHGDIGGYNWMREVNQKHRDGKIIIYKIGNRNWFVLPKYRNEFLTEFPTAIEKRQLNK